MCLAKYDSINKIHFLEGLYSDVRIKHIDKTCFIADDHTVHKEILADENVFIRGFNGVQWQCSVSSLAKINEVFINLCNKLKVLRDQDEIERYIECLEKNVERIEPSPQKVEDDLAESLVHRYRSYVENKEFDIKVKLLFYVESNEFISSIGTHTFFEKHMVEVSVLMKSQKINFQEVFYCAACDVETLQEKFHEFEEWVKKMQNFLYARKATFKSQIMLANKPAAIMIHECVGHISEYDLSKEHPEIAELFKMKYEVSSLDINVVDDGRVKTSGWTPFDDEGIRAKKTYIIENGHLNNMLYDAESAHEQECEPTGNARAISGNFPALIRMTNTYLEPMGDSYEKVISCIEDGIYVESFKTCFGYYNVTLTPNRAYEIRGGKISSPIILPPIECSALDLLGKISVICNDLKFYSSVFTGCAKKEQFFLPVGLGSPHVLISGFNNRISK